MAGKVKDPMGGGAGIPNLDRRLLQQEKLRETLTKPVSWATVRTWGVVMCVLWVLGCVLCAVVGAQYSHLSQLFSTRDFTQSQWAAAVHSKGVWQFAGYVALFACAFVNARMWRALKPYLAQLPGIAPHPGLKRELVPGLRVPALWPPVPAGQPSWTRKVPWRIPGALSAAFMLLGGAVVLVDRWTSVSDGKFSELADQAYAAAAMGVLALVFQLVRLVHVARWPRVPAGVSAPDASAAAPMGA